MESNYCVLHDLALGLFDENYGELRSECEQRLAELSAVEVPEKRVVSTASRSRQPTSLTGLPSG